MPSCRREPGPGALGEGGEHMNTPQHVWYGRGGTKRGRDRTHLRKTMENSFVTQGNCTVPVPIFSYHLLPSPQLLLSWKTKKTQHSVHSVPLPFHPVTTVHVYEDAGTHNTLCWDVPSSSQPGDTPLMQGPGGRSAEDVGRTLDLSQGLSLRLALPRHSPDPGQHPGA